MDDIVSTLLFVFSLGVLVFIHELGHFAMAKWFNVYVKEFAIGFGPVLFQIKKGETTYSIRAFPLGGYVAMFGEEVTVDGIDIPQSRSLQGVSKPKRALIMSAGIVLNLVLAFVLFFLSNWGFTQRTLTNQLVVEENSIAETAGIASDEVLVFTSLVAGTILVDTELGDDTYRLTLVDFESYEDTLSDLIVFVSNDNGTASNATAVYTPTDALSFVSFNLPIRTYASETEFSDRQVLITLPAVNIDGTWKLAELGVSFLVYAQDYDFAQAFSASVDDWTRGVTLIVDSVFNLFRGQNLDQVGGIVAIFSTTSSILNTLGLGSYIFIWALISVNLAVFNLLPFPGLDGWHLLVITLEGIFRKEIPTKVKNVLSLIGFFILMALMVLLIVRDVIALTVGL
jgi:regulator of sigma E protease